MITAVPSEPLIQIYRGGVPGASASTRRDLLARGVASIAKLGLENVCFHGFPRELVPAWDGLAKLAEDNGLGAVASWGLDGEADNDGTRLTGREKGDCMGQVLARSSCLAGLADAEGRWDTHVGAGDVTDEDDALALGEALRARAPLALVGDQCWFAIDSHGEVRTTPLVADPQNAFRGFPVDEFARKAVNWGQFRQMYCNEAGFKSRWGRSRYEKVRAWMERDWALLKAPFQRAGLFYEPGVTLQSYGWQDTVSDLMHCLISFAGEKNQPVIMWSDWYPDSVTVACIQGLLFLRKRGFVTPGRPALDAVKRYQREFNSTAPASKLIDTDGACGLKTLASMGIVPTGIVPT